MEQKSVSQLSTKKRMLFEALLREKNTGPLPVQRIPRRQQSDFVPTSFAQQRLWFIDQWEPGNPYYNIPSAVRLIGQLNIAALEQGLNEVVRRHEALRTTFMTVGKQLPVQVIAQALKVPLPLVDLGGLSEGEREVAAHRLVTEEAHWSFDLAHGPLLRASVLRLAEQEHILLLNLHHIVTDGWSVGIFIRELTTLYQAFARGAPSPLPELPIQYADFAVWQRAWLQGAVLEQQVAYWKQQLSAAPAALDLPTDRPRPPVRTYHGASQAFQVSGHLTAGLRALSREAESTLFMTLLAAFNVLLYRYTGQTDLLVGTPIANRTRTELEGLIGFFVNTLVLRTDLSGGPTFRAVLGRVREMTLGAYAHQDVPFEKLVEELQPERDLSRSPLFQVMFALQNISVPSVKLADLTVEPFKTNSRIARFDMILYMMETGPELWGEVEYNTDLFDADTIARLVGHFQTMLEGTIANPEACISDLPLLTQAERQQVLVDWNDTGTAYPQGSCVHELFEAQVERTPDAVAVVYEESQLTYRELNHRANQLAHYLRKQGVEPETLVGVCLERSLEAVVGLLGVLKAGGAYLPLDPAYPQERLTFMLEDAQPSVMLVQQRLLERLPGYPARVICLDTESETNWESEANPIREATAENLAYVMFTSGSTGRPKGISIVHRSIVRLVKEAHYADLTADEVFLQFAPISFDASTLEIWGPLLNGARLVVLPAGIPSLEELGQALQRYQVTTLWLTAGLFHQMVDNRLDDLHHVRQLLAGGDVLSVSHVQRVLHELRECRLINGYGPTESTTFTCCYPMTDPKQVGATVSIGHPIANTQVYILDRYWQPVPVGIPGELYIGGDGLARGYLNRPDFTAERFIPNPFGDKPGARLYKTGDIVRYLPDGNIEFQGRIDYQIKVRGFRIELEEIEVVLRQHPAVREAVVVARDVSGDVELQRTAGRDLRPIAYVVLQDRYTPAMGDLRRFMQSKLPDYMVPSAFVLLAALPLTPIGKVDRRALPAPDQGRLEAGKDFVAPRTPTEQILASIWAQVLGIKQVGIYDDFFESGGHSLLATQLISRLRQAFQIELPLRSLFEEPTVAGLSKSVEVLQRAQQGPAAPPLQPVARDGELKLSFAQQRLWFLDQLEPGSPLYNIPVAVRLRGSLDAIALRHGLNATVRRHEALRTSFQMIDDHPVQVITPTLALALPVIDLRRLSEAEREAEAQRLTVAEARRPFDLAHGPLIRASLLHLNEQEYILLLTMHHIISDGWSIGVFIQEIASFYRAFSAGSVASLPELPIQYADFAAWQREQLQGTVLEEQLAYWKEQLSNAPTVLDLPADHPRPPVRTSRGATHTFRLSAQLTEALRMLSQAEETTLFMTLLAAFDVLLYRYSGQSDIVVGTPIANRTSSEIEGLIGFFVNTLALRIDLAGSPTFREVLRRVREVTLEAYAHQDVPFEMLVEKLQRERDLSRTPLFQVMFVLQNTPLQPLELPDLTLSPLAVDNGTAKFDLTLAVAEVENGLNGLVEYSADLFEASTIARMAGHFQTLLEGIIADPERRVWELPLLTDTEQRQLTIEWNDTQVEHLPAQCAHELFEAQVERTPDAVAVVFEDRHVTYRELNERANQLAHYLHRLGVGPDVCVGVCMERCVELVIGIYSILKAGGAYVPLDPAYPTERLAYILTDAAVPVLLTQEKLLSILPTSPVQVICLDVDGETIAQLSTANPAATAVQDNLAYVIYTSGSTGKPKGTLIPHRGLVNYLTWCQHAYPLATGRGAPIHSSISFDLTITSLFGPLMTGRTVHLLPDDLGVEKLGQALQTCPDFSLVKITPAHLELLGLQLAPQEAAGCTRAFVIGGENLLAEHIAFWQQYAPDTLLINEYGPTETVVGCCVYRLPSGRWPSGAVPIGRPIINTQLYVLDQHLRPVPIGVAGEVHIGGVGVARGYLNRPELTAEKFVPDPFSNQPGMRLYKTGDLARYLPDGNIEYLGRIDHQVKVRGFRIELGEIEAALGQHPMVKEAVVVVQDISEAGALRTPSRDLRLAAYIVPQAGQTLTTNNLRRFLQDKLPDYMVPSIFVTLEELPLTPNGKIDRRALPAADGIRLELTGTVVAPRDSLELQLAQIWQDVLGVQPVGVKHNFFELGGHSLLAVRVLARIRQALGYQLPLMTLFHSPTIEHLAATLRAGGITIPFSSLVPMQVVDTNRQPFFFVHPVGGNVFCYADLIRHLGPDRSIYGLQARGLDGRQAPHTRIEAMSSHYVELLRTVQPEGPYLLGGWSMGGVVAFEMAQQFQAQGQEVALLALIDSYISADREHESDGVTLLANFAVDLGLPLDQVTLELGYLEQLEPDKQLAYALDMAKQMGIVPPDVGLSQIRQLFHIFKSNVQALRAYMPRPYSGPIILFKANERPDEEAFVEDQGWGAFNDGQVKIHQVPGNHYSIIREPNVEILAERLLHHLHAIEA